MNIHYMDTSKFRIVPRYEGSSPVGFDVVKIRTGEVVTQTKMLYEAEEFIQDSKKEPSEVVIGSAAEVRHY